MGVPSSFPGMSTVLAPPDGLEDEVLSLPVFRNGSYCLSVWELSEEELAEIIESKRVYVSVLAGGSQPPMSVGSEEAVREACMPYGVWPRRPLQ